MPSKAMTTKRNLQKRLERLEAQRKMQRTAKERFDGEVSSVVSRTLRQRQ